MKLFTIGDSISQGFMSLAAARSDLAYSTILSEAMENPAYSYPEWLYGGMPANLEEIFRRLYRRYGKNISLFEWPLVIATINNYLDDVEDYYERREGNAMQPYPGGYTFFHNVSVRGFDVADSWGVRPVDCYTKINTDTGAGDGFLKGPSASFYRTALKVLNPSLADEYMEYNQLDWLSKHAKEEGVENLILWLGANNALGTILDLKVSQTPGDQSPATMPHLERAKKKWNLWHPADFKAEYELLINKGDTIMQSNKEANWNVFIGTVPLVTIAPLAKGVGPTTKTSQGIYYKYYTYIPFEEEFAQKQQIHLTMHDAMHIDRCILEYNQIIKDLVAKYNKKYNSIHYSIVDIATLLTELAYKRNNGEPNYDRLPSYFKFVYPQVNTKYYHANKEGRFVQGGLFGLDGVHPSAIGHGIIANEFMNVMKGVGVQFTKELNWPQIFKNDLLYSNPIPIMHELYENENLATWMVRLMKLANAL